MPFRRSPAYHPSVSLDFRDDDLFLFAPPANPFSRYALIGSLDCRIENLEQEPGEIRVCSLPFSDDYFWCFLDPTNGELETLRIPAAASRNVQLICKTVVVPQRLIGTNLTALLVASPIPRSTALSRLRPGKYEVTFQF
ncbi:unnamed protein product, partial [Mesorhabditis belari]|uniref:Flagellar assembly factor FliW n=1 Tax=Mesorhabditis belari TaxID=2138241 RepID=A0AAF3EIL2_9BILA